MYRKKIIIVDPVHPHLLVSLKKKFSLVKYSPKIRYNELSRIIKNFHIIILRSGLSLDKSLIKKAKQLKIIARAGVGLDNIDTEFAKKNKIKYFNIPSKSSLSVAEFAFGLLLSAARKINFADANLRKNIWNKSEMYGYEISYKSLGIIGFGDIGSKIAKIGKKFNMKIFANVKNFSNTRKKKFKKKNIILTSLNYLMKHSDFVIISVPLNRQTKDLINIKNLKFLKENSIIINISRGGVIKERDLLSILRKRKIFAAGIDVFKKEKKYNNLFKLKNTVLTPHIGAMTYEAQKKIALSLEKKLFNLVKKI